MCLKLIIIKFFCFRDERMTQFCIAHDIKTLTPILTKQSPQLTKVS